MTDQVSQSQDGAGVEPSGAELVRPRVEQVIAHLNRGEIDDALAFYADDVTVLVTNARPGDAVVEPMSHGKASAARLLARFVAAYAPFRLAHLELEPPQGFKAVFDCRGGPITYHVTLNAQGLGIRAVVSMRTRDDGSDAITGSS